MDYFPEIEWFFGAILLYNFLYLFVDFEYRGNDSYHMLSVERKRYFQKNIVKAFSLLIISIYGTLILINGFCNESWDNVKIRRVGYIYSALDFLGLLKVPNLPTNSKIHHFTTFILSYLNTFIDYSKPSFWIGLPVYCILSCYACGVNLFLGQRLIKPISDLTLMIKLNIVSYVFLLMVNWTYQIYNFHKNVGLNFYWDSGLYFILLIFVANDDVKLVRFLYHYLRKADKIERLANVENI